MAVSETQDYGIGPDESLRSTNGNFTAETEPFIYTSLRYDLKLKKSPKNTAVSFNIPCPIYMLEHHWTRLQVANWSAQFWPKGLAPQTQGRPGEFLRSLLIAVKQWQRAHPLEAEWAESLRVRRRAYPSGRVTTEIWQIPPKPLETLFPKTLDLPRGAAQGTEWTVVLDDRPTEVTESTMFKTWDRSPQSRARADAGILSVGTTKDVLLFNSDNEILDGSNSTPYFYRDGGWVTPISSSGGLQGTTRRWALEQGLCTEAVVLTDSFKDGEFVWLSNAVRGFFWAVYHTRDPNMCPASAAQSQHVLRQLS